MHYLDPVPHPDSIAPHRNRNTKVTCRKYGLTLHATRFSPYEESLPDWINTVAAEACRQGMKFDVDTQPPGKRRRWYVDTVDWYLRRNGLSIRITDGGSHDKRFEIRLNGIHRDRYLAAVTGVAGRGNAVHEFSEEIRPTHSQYVKSCTITRQKFPRIDSLSDAARLFPGIDQYLGSRRDEAVTIVGGMVALELDNTIGEGAFGGCPPLRFELTSTYTGMWRLGRRIDEELEKHAPDIVEFAFRYDCLPDAAGLERFPFENVLLGRRLFESLSSKHDWVDQSGATCFDVFFQRSGIV